MREISAKEITGAVRELFMKANVTLPYDARECIENASRRESDPRAKGIFSIMLQNLDVAAETGVPICQDTGMAVVFADVGQDLHISGGDFTEAVNEGVRRAYADGFFRRSVVRDPLFGRENTGDNTPAVIHVRIVPGDRLRLVAAPKGFGSENMSAVRMFTPSASKKDIIDFVCETVKNAGGNPCPPLCVGVGIGGDFELCAEQKGDAEFHACFYRRKVKQEEKNIPMRPAALTNMPLIDEKLGNIAVNFWELTWNDEHRQLPYEIRLLLSLTNAVGAGRMRQATRELVKAYIRGLNSAALDDVFELLAWNQGIGYFSSEVGLSTLFAACKTIKHMEKQGKERSEICEALKEKFGEKNPDVKA